MKIAGAYLVCPECHKISVCSCNACRRARESEGITEFKEHTVDKYDIVKCPYCGFEAHMDYWCDYNMNAYENFIYERVREYVEKNRGVSLKEFKKTHLGKSYYRQMKYIMDTFDGKKVEIEYVSVNDFITTTGRKQGRIKVENGQIKFYEGRRRTKFFYLDLGLYEGFKGVLVIKRIYAVA